MRAYRGLLCFAKPKETLDAQATGRGQLREAHDLRSRGRRARDPLLQNPARGESQAFSDVPAPQRATVVAAFRGGSGNRCQPRGNRSLRRRSRDYNLAGLGFVGVRGEQERGTVLGYGQRVTSVVTATQGQVAFSIIAMLSPHVIL